MEFISQILKYRVVGDYQFLVNIYGFVPYAKLKVIRLPVFKERMLLNGFVPVYCGAARVVDFIYLCEQIPVLVEVIDKPYCCA